MISYPDVRREKSLTSSKAGISENEAVILQLEIFSAGKAYHGAIMPRALSAGENIREDLIIKINLHEHILRDFMM
ncbi:hypothetical protein H9Q72_014495, partial [Fusarium xylarioides]